MYPGLSYVSCMTWRQNRYVSVMLESHASSADEKPSIWSQISSSILTMLSTRSSESETSVVVVIFPTSPLEKSVPRQVAARSAFASRLRSGQGAQSLHKE